VRVKADPDEIELLVQSKRELEAQSRAWDAQIASDLKAGKLDHLIANARIEMEAGLALEI
jgi:hypothetical protein